ncbi:MAG: hypothetical protein HUJ95_00405 [Bacteroidales bacterium]|nr:hypothetical protein [Bacteroidales bacterium]
MRNRTFIVVIFVLLQIVVCKYLGFSPFVTISLLPALVLFSNERTSAPVLMISAFAMGMFVDLFGEGLIGLNASCLVFLAFFRRLIALNVLGKMYIPEKGFIKYESVPTLRLFLAILSAEMTFFVPYFILDGCTTVGALISIERLLIALVINLPVCYYVGRAISD